MRQPWAASSPVPTTFCRTRGQSPGRDSCPTQNSFNHTDSRLSANLTEIYTPLCSYRFQLSHGTKLFCRRGEPHSILHPPTPALYPSSPHRGSPHPLIPTQGRGPEGPPVTAPGQRTGSTQGAAGTSALHSLPLTGPCREQELGPASVFTYFPILGTCDRQAVPRGTALTRQSGAAGHAAGRWGCWRRQTWGNSLHWGKKK